MRSLIAALLVLFAAPADARERVDPAAVHAVPATGKSLGPASAKVTLVVAVQYSEPFTKRLWPTLMALRKEYGKDLRLVFRNFVVHPRRGRQAGLAVCAAGQQGKYVEMAERLMGGAGFRFSDDQFTDDRLREHADALGMNTRRFLGDLHGSCEAAVDRDVSELKKFGVRGVPATFVNGRMLNGAQPKGRFQAVIDDELKLARKRLRGRSGKGYYRRFVLGRGAKKAQMIASKGLPAEAPPPRQRFGRPDPALVYAVPTGNGAFLGPLAAPITMVIAVEFAEPFTQRLRPVLDSLRKKYGRDLRLVFRHRIVHQNTGRPAALSICAATRQGKFLEMESEIWDKAWPARDYSDSNLESLARGIGLNMNRFTRDRDGVCAREVDFDDRELTRFGVRGVPGTFINGRFISGARPEGHFTKVIDEELAKARKRIGKRGTTRRNYYDRWVVGRGAKSVSP